MQVKYREEVLSTPILDHFDLIVSGGGVAGAAAAIAARRKGKRVLLIEKSLLVGGLATIGLINTFVPMCNGHGINIIKGMCSEFIDLAIKYGYDTVPPEWKNGEPGEGAKERYYLTYSPDIFAMALAEQLQKDGVEILLDTIVTAASLEDGVIKGLSVENKTGRAFYGADLVIDATGDADVLFRAGIPTVQGKNYFTYITNAIDLEHCAAALKSQKINHALYSLNGGSASLSGDNQPEGVSLFNGTTTEEITDYVLENQKLILEKLQKTDRFSRDIVRSPTMPQFRTTRHIDGEYTFKAEDAYRHFEDSIGTISDFGRKDFLYEIPYRCLYKKSYRNVLAVGRAASATGYGWDLLRVIPPAIITGQAAGIAASMALDSRKAVYEIPIEKLQQELDSQNVMIHFKDEWIPA